MQDECWKFVASKTCDPPCVSANANRTLIIQADRHLRSCLQDIDSCEMIKSLGEYCYVYECQPPLPPPTESPPHFPTTEIATTVVPPSLSSTTGHSPTGFPPPRDWRRDVELGSITGVCLFITIIAFLWLLKTYKVHKKICNCCRRRRNVKLIRKEQQALGRILFAVDELRKINDIDDLGDSTIIHCLDQLNRSIAYIEETMNRYLDARSRKLREEEERERRHLQRRRRFRMFRGEEGRRGIEDHGEEEAQGGGSGGDGGEGGGNLGDGDGDGAGGADSAVNTLRRDGLGIDNPAFQFDRYSNEWGVPEEENRTGRRRGLQEPGQERLESVV